MTTAVRECGRFSYKNPGTMEKFGVPGVHQDPEKPASQLLCDVMLEPYNYEWSQTRGGII